MEETQTSGRMEMMEVLGPSLSLPPHMDPKLQTLKCRHWMRVASVSQSYFHKLVKSKTPQQAAPSRMVISSLKP